MYEREMEAPHRTFKPPAKERSNETARSCSRGSQSRQEEGFGHNFGRVPILAKGPAGPPPTVSVPDIKTEFEDCPATWQAKIKETASMARNWVDFSIGKIDAVLAHPNLEAPKTHEMLRTHFHVGSAGPKENVFEEITAIRRNFAKIQAGFAGTLPFECETSCDPKFLGYVLGGPFHLFRGMSDVHICPLWFQDFDRMEQVNTIIHEMAHKYANRADQAYEDTDKYAKLPVSDAIDNADSYSTFAQYI